MYTEEIKKEMKVIKDELRKIKEFNYENLREKVIEIVIERDYDNKFYITRKHVFKYLTKLLEREKNANSKIK